MSAMVTFLCVTLSYINFDWVCLVSFGLVYVVLVWINLNYVSLMCEREMLAVDYFAILGIGFPASVELSCRAKETTFTEGGTQDTFSKLWYFLFCNLSA
jgi:hypothetical protein